MAKQLFDHLNQIYEKQDVDYWETLDDASKKTFNVYMINRFISMNVDYLPVVDELQQYWSVLSPREVYLFYSQLLPKKRQFNKYIKGLKDSNTYEKWLIELVVKHFEISQKEAEEYLRIMHLSVEGKEYLREFLRGYGFSDKEIKKAKI